MTTFNYKLVYVNHIVKAFQLPELLTKTIGTCIIKNQNYSRKESHLEKL